MVGLGRRRAPEGWRRTVGILLRSEHTRFALSAFGLHVPAGAGSIEDRIARGLLAFLGTEPDAHFSLDWLPDVTVRSRIPWVDMVVLRFAADGRLEGVRPWWSAQKPGPPDAIQQRVHAVIVEAYNRTRGLPEVTRPRKLHDLALAALSTGARVSPEDLACLRRTLAACCLSFETADAPARFSPPAFCSRQTLGFGYLSCVARASLGDTVDLWMSAHHVGLDGVPLQDLLSRLERAWGTAAVTFPAATPGRAFSGPHRCHADGERPVELLTTFVDFTPVLELRRALTAQLGCEVTFGALVAWLFSQEPEFAGVRVASTVDVPASHSYERDVDVVSLRPADYATGPGPWDGLEGFAREFNRLIAACRERTSPVRVGMQTAGHLPAWAHSTLVRSAPAALDETFGTLCVTIIRDARVFVAPMTDLGLGLGFIAIGSATLPSASGGVVTSVSMKGDAGRIQHYPAILQRVIDRCSAAL